MNRDDAERRFVEIRPCAHTEGCFSVWLIVEQQSFCLDYVTDNYEEAEFMAEMLHKALSKIADLCRENNQPGRPGPHYLTVMVEVEQSIFTDLRTATMPTTDGECSEINLGETKYITGNWQKVGE